MFNQSTLLGNLTRDLELKYTASGTAIASCGIATSHKYTSNGERKEETMFIDVTWMGKSAETANTYLRKGSKVLIVGRLKLDQWTDQTSGQKRSKHTVMVESFKMLDGKPSEEKPPYQPPEPTYEDHPQKQQPKHTDYQPKVPERQEMPRNTLPDIQIDEDMEIPF